MTLSDADNICSGQYFFVQNTRHCRMNAYEMEVMERMIDMLYALNLACFELLNEKEFEK